MDEVIPDEIQPSSFDHEAEFMVVLKNFLEEDVWVTPVTGVGNASSPQLSRLSAIVEFLRDVHAFPALNSMFIFG